MNLYVFYFLAALTFVFVTALPQRLPSDSEYDSAGSGEDDVFDLAEEGLSSDEDVFHTESYRKLPVD